MNTKRLSSLSSRRNCLTQTIALLLPLMALSLPTQAIELNQTVEDAILHNPELREQVKAYRAIEADLRGAKGSWYPTIDVSAGIGYEEVDNQTVDNIGDGLTRRETAVRLTQNLFEGFATENEIKRQQHRLGAAAYQVYATANQIALDMTEAYLNLLKQKELLKLAEDNVSTHQKILDQIIQRFEAGIGNQVEVDQAKARLALAQSNLMAEKNNYTDTMSRFQRVLGRFPDSELIPPSSDLILPKTVDEAVNTALISHPTILSANADISEAQAQYDLSERNYYPRVDLEVERTWDHNLAGIEGRNEDFQAMVRLRYNLYNGGKDKAERDRTASAMQQAVEIRNNSRRQAIENINYAWNAYQYVGSQLDYVQSHIKLTYETLEGYRKQFSLGRRSLLDLLNTEDEYISALRTLVNSETEYKIAKYRILNGMGTLLDNMDIQLDMVNVDAQYAEN
ncbi:TolC family outer membrane protein [Thiomicrorhabdus sp. zzn3]|uniref:TolC family outer membrane protein n=1 Tax=Thiomicrorhabdus sp. zzn3 TaxID=3039775 RepID=UPI002436E957|nr:TolC family outer membrane protein [Thiomicrorhabdus sp. zzn3]MDG6778955.1 TolC family outer membrane protein [Thiomicrorhabdus sp. zzn3]